MIGLFLMGTVYVYAKVRRYPVAQRASAKEFFSALRGAIFALITPAIIVGGIVGGFFTPTEASVIAVLYAAALGGLVYRTLGRKEFGAVLHESARLSAVSLFCIGTASAFGWLLAYYRVPQAFVGALSGWATGPISAGLLIALAFLIIGCFIDAIPAIIIMGTILLPLAQNAGMHPIHFALIGVISLAFGLVTPPYGLCLLIAASIGQIKVVATLKDVGIILTAILLVLLLVIVFPELVLFLPRLIAPQFVD